MASSCRSTSRSRTTRRSSTARGRTRQAVPLGAVPDDPGAGEVAKAYLAQLGKAGVYPAPIVTAIEGAKAFHPAEDYHQDFLVRNPTYPYIVINDLPKVANLKKHFPDLYRAKPALVAAASQ